MTDSSLYFLLGGSIILNVILFIFCYGLFVALGEIQKKRSTEYENPKNATWNRIEDEELDRMFVASAGKRDSIKR